MEYYGRVFFSHQLLKDMQASEMEKWFNTPFYENLMKEYRVLKERFSARYICC
jgi:hypothetical protein